MSEHRFQVALYSPSTMAEKRVRCTVVAGDRTAGYHKLRQEIQDGLFGGDWIVAEPGGIVSEAQSDPTHRPGLPGSDFFGDALVRFPRRV